MSIVRVGLAETKKFSDGYDLIFGKKEQKPEEEKKEVVPKCEAGKDEKTCEKK